MAGRKTAGTGDLFAPVNPFGVIRWVHPGTDDTDLMIDIEARRSCPARNDTRRHWRHGPLGPVCACRDDDGNLLSTERPAGDTVTA